MLPSKRDRHGRCLQSWTALENIVVACKHASFSSGFSSLIIRQISRLAANANERRPQRGPAMLGEGCSTVYSGDHLDRAVVGDRRRLSFATALGVHSPWGRCLRRTPECRCGSVCSKAIRGIRSPRPSTSGWSLSRRAPSKTAFRGQCAITGGSRAYFRRFTDQGP